MCSSDLDVRISSYKILGRAFPFTLLEPRAKLAHTVTVPVHICTGTIALPFSILMFLFVILMFYLYGIKGKMNQTFFVSPFTGQAATSLWKIIKN